MGRQSNTQNFYRTRQIPALEGFRVTDINETTWPEKYPQELITAEFDFGPSLPYGDAIASTQLFITTVQGVDATPDNVRNGVAIIKGARAFQRLKAGLAGCSYLIECHATTVNGNLLIIPRVLPVVALLT